MAQEKINCLQQTLGEPNLFRLKYRNQIRALIKHIIVDALSPAQASEQIKTFALEIPQADRTKFIEVINEELLSLHEGNFARYQATPKKFERWREAWRMTSSEGV